MWKWHCCHDETRKGLPSLELDFVTQTINFILVFGLDDMTSTTTRSLDLDSLLGGQWGAGQSVSDSETDTQGLRHIKSQLEGLETMYSEVLKMLGARPGRMDGHLRNARRRQGSLSSLPSSSVSGRPIRDRRRNDERRKVRDIKVWLPSLFINLSTLNSGN